MNALRVVQLTVSKHRMDSFARHQYCCKQGVALTGRDTTGPPRAAPGELRCICAALQTTDYADRRRQTPTIITSLATYTMCRRASNKGYEGVRSVRRRLSYLRSGRARRQPATSGSSSARDECCTTCVLITANNFNRLIIIIIITRNREKAQSVARTAAQTRLCISYLPTDWLCYCHLANDLKNQRTAYFSRSWLTIRANEPQGLRDYWTKVHQIYSLSNVFIDGVNAIIRVAIRPPVVKWQGRQLKKESNIGKT